MEEREGARPESDPGTDTHKRTEFLTWHHREFLHTRTVNHTTYRAVPVLKQKAATLVNGRQRHCHKHAVTQNICLLTYM